jgi:nitroreductase
VDIFEAVFTRRSVRSFLPAPVSGEQVQTMLEAAMAAPSAGNAQPWEFIVVTDRALLDAIPGIHPYAAMCRQAPLAFLVCADTGREKYPGFWVQDCSAAVQNLLLAARGLGLGAVWTGIHPVAEREAAFRELFGLPAGVVPLALVPVGHTSLPQGRKDRFEAARVHRNRWEGR